MKINILVLLAALALTGGCASDKQASDSSPKQEQQQKDPEIGMTKEQIIAMYGKTDNMQVTSDGETWIYHLNAGEAFIPFNFGYRPKMRTIQFDKEGKVSHWSYSK